MNERTVAALMSSLLPSGRSNACFESDAEVIQVNGQPCLFTTDEFSQEDLFRESQPYAVGWNIAAGAVSDIFACGGTPLYYAHALTVPPHWDERFLREFGQGVRDVLLATGTGFIGGDCSRANQWRCTSSVIGRCNGTPLARTGAAAGDAVYISGPVGKGNVEAALSLRLLHPGPNGSESPTSGASADRNLFALRPQESACLRNFASACIDTSDGVWSSLNALADLGDCGYAVADLPYDHAGTDLCARAGIPVTMLFLGGCGEYELLFTVRREKEEAFRISAAASGLAFHRLGTMTAKGRTLQENGLSLDLSTLRIDPRDFSHPREYVLNLLNWLAAQPEGRAPASPHLPSNADERITAS